MNPAKFKDIVRRFIQAWNVDHPFDGDTVEEGSQGANSSSKANGLGK